MTVMIPAWSDGTLQPIEKMAAHLRGLRHKAVSVFVLAEGRILLQRRALGKYHTPGLWANTCCTHPEWGESDADCALRRLDEELAITGLAPQYRGQVEYRAEVGNGMIEHEVVQVFVASAEPDLHHCPHPDEVMETRWLAPDQLAGEIAHAPERFTPWLKVYMAEHSDLIFGQS